MHGFDYVSFCDGSLEISDESMSDFDEIDSKALLSLLPCTSDHNSIGKFDNEDEPVMILDVYDVDESYQSPAHGGNHDDDSYKSPTHGGKHVDEIYKSPAHGGNDDDESCKPPAHGGNLDDESYKSPTHGGKHDDESKHSPAHGVNHDEDHVSVTSPDCLVIIPHHQSLSI